MPQLEHPDEDSDCLHQHTGSELEAPSPSISSCIQLLPDAILSAIVASSGVGGPVAALACKALCVAWRDVLVFVPLIARFLVSRYGLVTAARHIYRVGERGRLLHGLTADQKDAVMLELLREVTREGAQLDLHDALLLSNAARAGHCLVVSELLTCGAVHPTVFALARTLTAATEHGHRHIVRQLLAAGARPSAYHSSALLAAASYGDADIVYDMCAAGADVTADSSKALQRAVQLGHAEAAAVLLQYGADPRASCSAALHHACSLSAVASPPGTAVAAAAGSRSGAAAAASSEKRGANSTAASDGEEGVLRLVRMLLRAGADPRGNGRPALEAAAGRGHARVVRVLLAEGTDPAACNSSALVAASIQGHTQVATLLLEAGADPWDVSDLALRTALERGHRPVVHIIQTAQRAGLSNPYKGLKTSSTQADVPRPHASPPPVVTSSSRQPPMVPSVAAAQPPRLLALPAGFFTASSSSAGDAISKLLHARGSACKEFMILQSAGASYEGVLASPLPLATAVATAGASTTQTATEGLSTKLPPVAAAAAAGTTSKAAAAGPSRSPSVAGPQAALPTFRAGSTAGRVPGWPAAAAGPSLPLDGKILAAAFMSQL